MTGAEYLQLKAFARIDGALLALWLIGCFACYVLGLASPTYGIVAMLLTAAAPLFVGWRLKKFRDNGLDGYISLMRGWGYVVFVFFYSGLLFALAQYGYFTYMDGGYMMNAMAEMMALPENSEMLRQMGVADEVGESLDMMRSLRPIDWSLNALMSLMIVGAVVGLPIAAVVQKRPFDIKN